MGPFEGPGRVSKQIFTFVPNFIFVILYFFFKRGPPNFISFRPHKTWIRSTENMDGTTLTFPSGFALLFLGAVLKS